MTLRTELHALLDAGELDLPYPGEGRTAQRLDRLYALAERDLSLARLVEAHTDALAILHESGRPAHTGLYGVWAAEGPSLHLDGGRIDGRKAFCTGAPIVDRALVTVLTADGPQLLDLPVAGNPCIDIDTDEWVGPAFAATETATITVTALRLEREDLVGGPGWYLQRPGFWHGALAPAACWAGGAAPLVDAVAAHAAERPDPHRDAHLGAMLSARWRSRQLLHAAAASIDAEPTDGALAHRVALLCRHEVEQATGELLDRFGRAMGPRPYAFDAALALRISEVQLYRRQCHAERDLAALAALDRDHPGR